MAWTDTNWKAESQKAAAYAAENNAQEGPTGVMRWGPPGTLALYGHIGDTAESRTRAVQCAAVARSLLANASVEVLGAGLDQPRRAWAILVESDAIDFLDAVASESWEIAASMTES